MTKLELILFLGCLVALAIQGYSSVRRRTSRRGNWTRPRLRLIAPSRPLSRAEVARLTAEVDKALSGSSWSSAVTVHPPTAATTAASTTTATSGSGPVSDEVVSEYLALIQVPMSEEPCRNTAPRSARGQFGMCDYPEREK